MRVPRADRSESDFGSYLATVYERDIDLLLMEEFHVSADFVTWFAELIGLAGAEFDGAWHSVTDADGETDLLLRVRIGEHLVGVLVENKVAAPEQERQDERYHIRAARAQGERKFDRFVTCISAPQVYLDGLIEERLYDSRVSYEAIAGWFAESPGPRSRWRHRVVLEAIQQGRRGNTMIVNPVVSRFHVAFWEHVQRNYPKLVMRRPTPKGNKSNWILLKGHDFPRGVQLHFKMDQCVVELGFSGRTVADILQRKKDWPEEIVPVQKQGTAALAIKVPQVDRLRSFDEQLDAMSSVFEVLFKLFPLARLFEAR
jgi:hypothetical protein